MWAVTPLLLAHEQGKCVIVVTHSKELARQADAVLRLMKFGYIEDTTL